jgi:hypothetical protein
MSYDFMPTIGGRGQRHPHGVVGNMWRIVTPSTVRVGDCFLAGRLKAGDVFYCSKHSGDCFQTYEYVKEYTNCYRLESKWSFGSYGIGDSELIELSREEKDELVSTGRITKEQA